jgi:hypothetical protein
MLYVLFPDTIMSGLEEHREKIRGIARHQNFLVRAIPNPNANNIVMTIAVKTTCHRQGVKRFQIAWRTGQTYYSPAQTTVPKLSITRLIAEKGIWMAFQAMHSIILSASTACAT